MKRLLVIITGLILTICLLSLLQIVSGQEAALKLYGIKSGIVEYSYSGEKVGKGILYFDNYGNKSAIFTDAVEDGEKRKGCIVTYGNFQYVWNPDDPGEGMKFKNPIIGWTTSPSGGDIESFTESLYLKMGMEKRGTETFLGKECKALEGKIGKVLTWNGIPMLLNINMTGHTSHEEVTNIQTNVQVDAKFFVIPKNIKFSEMPGI